MRATDRRHAYGLICQGVALIRREPFGSALEMGLDDLKLLGLRAHRAHRAAQTFRRHEEAALQKMAVLKGDDAILIAHAGCS